MERIGVVSPEQMHAMWQDYLTRQQLAPQLRYNFPQRRPVEDVSPHRVFVKNTEAEVIPAFACMRITGVEDVGERTCILVEKPSSLDGEFLFNGPYEIAVAADATEETPAELGVGWAYRHGVVTMLGDEPAYSGAGYGPIVDSWEIEEGGDWFTVFGRHDVSARALVGEYGTESGCAVFLDADLAAATNSKTGATSCLATIGKWSQSISDYVETSRQMTVWNHSERANHVLNTFGIAKKIDGHRHFFGDCEPMAAR